MSKSIDALLAAFAGESQARNKYIAFAKKADDEGYPQAAKLFRAAAQAEFIHAQNHFKAAGEIKSTAENLREARAGENYEVVSMYPPFIADAEAEGEKKAAQSMRWAFEVEKVHEALYAGALETLGQAGDAFDYYVCPVCGHTHPRSAPDKCPVCGTSGSKFLKIE
jgi:rubrerythrin